MKRHCLRYQSSITDLAEKISRTKKLFLNALTIYPYHHYHRLSMPNSLVNYERVKEIKVQIFYATFASFAKKISTYLGHHPARNFEVVWS